MNVPTEIVDRYKAGERVIRVSQEVYRDYMMSLTPNEYLGPFRPEDPEGPSLCYKDARVRPL